MTWCVRRLLTLHRRSHRVLIAFADGYISRPFQNPVPVCSHLIAPYHKNSVFHCSRQYSGGSFWIDDGSDVSSATTMIESEGGRNHEDGLSERLVGRTSDMQSHLQLLEPDSPPNSRLLRVAVIGRPNCGKSTLINALLGWRVSTVSGKVHTTRKNTLAVLTQEEVQIVFLDTPGILRVGSRKKHNLDRSLELDPIRSLATADIILAMVDVSWTTHVFDRRIMELLYLYRHVPAVLILNKIDLVKKRAALLQTIRILTDQNVKGDSTEHKRSRKHRLFDTADRKLGHTSHTDETTEESTETANPVIPPELTGPADPVPSAPVNWEEYYALTQQAQKALKGRRGWPLFQEVFKLSATRGEGMDDLKEFLLKKAVPRPWDYHSSLVTDQTSEEVVLTCVREKLLDNLHNEVPYRLGLDLVMMQVDPEDDLLNIVVNIKCESQRQLTIFLGRDGEMIRAISSQAKQAMMDTFRCDIRLKLVAVYKPKK